jgi:hypothetical protein
MVACARLVLGCGPRWLIAVILIGWAAAVPGGVFALPRNKGVDPFADAIA